MSDKITILNHNLTFTPVGCGVLIDAGATKIQPCFKRGYGNFTFRTTTNGDAVIGFPNGMEVDGDLVITISWGEGLGLFRIEDNGYPTLVDSNTTPMHPTYTSIYFNNVAVSKANKKIVLSNYSVAGVAIWDYAGNTLSQNTTMTTWNSQPLQTGNPYWSGMVAAGDYVYSGNYNSNGSYNGKYPRIHCGTLAESSVDGSHYTTSIYREAMFYDEVNDRIYAMGLNGVMIILDASTASPTPRYFNPANMYSTHAYNACLYLRDPVNKPNEVIIGNTSRFLECNVANVVANTTTSATLIGYYDHYNMNQGSFFESTYFRGGTKYQDDTTGQPTDRYPGQEWCPITSDRDRAVYHGWLDLENNRVVGYQQYSASLVEDTTTGGRGATYRTSYGQNPIRVYSSNGTPWWVMSGYGSHGHSMATWSNDIGPGLIGDWEVIITGFDSSSNIDYCALAGDDFLIPGGCSVSCSVSNDGGVNWSSYDYPNRANTKVVFSSANNSLQVKFTATGFEYKSPYYSSSTPIVVLFGNLYSSEKTPEADLKVKVAKFRLAGRSS